ncbi:MAG: hypothetical protein IIB69_08080 [Proteobacteria bacterium]|nr:hypothetical protein [Pseudomonadota bacterium]
MGTIFHDISKYYAANIYDNLLIVGRIEYRDDQYHFARDDVQGPFNLVADPDEDVTRMVQVIGEIHPRSALEDILEVKVSSCLYLNEDNVSNEIAVRSIHNGLGTSIYSKQECPLILWNPNYEEDKYFDVIDVQRVFTDIRLKNSFMGIISESLRELELFPPLMHLKKD